MLLTLLLAVAALPLPVCAAARPRDADRVAGLLEANNIYNTKLLVNRVRPDMIQKNDMMSVRDVQVRRARDSTGGRHAIRRGSGSSRHACRRACSRLRLSRHARARAAAGPPQEMLGIPLLGAIPEDQQVIISTNRGEPLVLAKKLSLSGIAFENAARRLIGKQDFMVDLDTPYKGVFQKIGEMFTTS